MRGIWDAFPVSAGHALIVTKRHVESWFEATAEEQAELIAATRIARRLINEEHDVDGYNIGVNIGTHHTRGSKLQHSLVEGPRRLRSSTHLSGRFGVGSPEGMSLQNFIDKRRV